MESTLRRILPSALVLGLVKLLVFTIAEKHHKCILPQVSI